MDLSWDWGWVTLNLAYVAYTASPLFKEMMRMRVMMIVVTVLYIVYGLVDSIWSIVIWNIVFGALQLWQIFKLVRQRMNINLSEEALGVRALLFPDLDKPMFNIFWNASTERVFPAGTTVLKQGDPVEELLLIMEGEADIETEADHNVRLYRLCLIGEMTSVAGGGARATVTAPSRLRVRAWNKAELTKLGQEHPDIERSALVAIGQDLARKVV